MKLFGSTRSPYVMKVFVAAHELGVRDQIALHPVVVSKTTTDDAVAAVNPLGQVPTLVLDSGVVLYDSLVICEYLDALKGPGRLVPALGEARWDVLTRHALGQGLADVLTTLLNEHKRVDDPLHPTYVRAFEAKIQRSLGALDGLCTEWIGRDFDLGHIAIATALAYADFRFSTLEWRAAYPALANYYAPLAGRASMQAAKLQGPPTAPAS